MSSGSMPDETLAETEAAHNCRIVTVAVMSDLHVYSTSDSGQEPSTIRVGAPEDRPETHPIVGLEAMISSENLQAEVLLCPGDLGNKADEAGMAHGWAAVHRVARALQDATVIGTAGNHDLQSRSDRPDGRTPQEVLQRLRPRFPAGTREAAQRFFAEHYAIVDGAEDWRVVTLNTSALHGYPDREFDFGRVSENTRESLLADLREDRDRRLPPPINILLCHHHPMEFTAVDEPDPSSVRGGALLLQMLASGEFGRWVVVHGHKHVPNLTYAAGGSASPVVFSAGSVSAGFHLGQAQVTRNQFYVIRFDLDRALALGLRSVATYDSWYWVQRKGWLRTEPGSGLPAHGGFGCRTDGARLAAQILAWMTEEQRLSANQAVLFQAFPEVEFLVPADLELLRLELELLGSAVETDNNGRPTSVTPRAIDSAPVDEMSGNRAHP